MMNRIGFHYIPDTQHYRLSDLKTWLPELQTLRASWVVLQAPPDRAIPEDFLRGLLDAGIEPVLQFNLSPDRLPPLRDLFLLFRAYAKWGVRYLTLFVKPNLRSAWQTTNWAQTDLVERFLDIYLPLADNCLNAGLIPIFPPLEPGGDYWDTAFLRTALAGIKRRGYKHLLDKLVVGAIARADQPLNWGAGGPECWPRVRPYYTPEGEEDQCGFRIFDWYNAFIRSVLVEPRPIFLFEVGCSPQEGNATEMHTRVNLSIAQLLSGKEVEGLEPIPAYVIGSAFWLLAAPYGDPRVAEAWYRSPADYRPIVEALRNQTSNYRHKKTPKTLPHIIEHYLLLPSYQGQISDFHLDLIRPIIKKYHPTIGFSIQEARQAKRVTIVGGPSSYPQTDINQLRHAGCIVQQINDHGIDIASFLTS